MADTPVPFIELFGEPEENFYQLGLKDKEKHFAVINHMQAMLQTPWPLANTLVKEVGINIMKRYLKANNQFSKCFKAYCEGLDRSFEEMALSVLIPEFLSGLGGWLPQIPLGCSSFFYIDEDNQAPTHTRILDFPLKDSYDLNERIVNYNLNGWPTIMSFSSVGMPYPSITAMTEYGVTFGLHQKFTNVIDSKGTPIFEIVMRLLRECGDLTSTLDFLKNQRSITTWCFNLTFANGDYLSADLSSNKLNYKSGKLEPKKIIYFNNDCLNEENLKKQTFPLGISNYNSMRCISATKKIEKLCKNKIDALSVHNEITTPLKQKNLAVDKWNIDCIGPASLQIVTMQPKAARALYSLGEAPKFASNGILEITGDENKINFKQITKTKRPSNFEEGIRQMMKAQASFDLGNEHEIYHHLQMAIDDLEGTHEGEIAHFYFLVFQSLYEKNIKVQKNLISDFKELIPRLPDYFKDISKVLIIRLEKITNTPKSTDFKDIHNPFLREVIEKEINLPHLAHKLLNSFLTYPRIDIMDVFFLHLERD